MKFIVGVFLPVAHSAGKGEGGKRSQEKREGDYDEEQPNDLERFWHGKILTLKRAAQLAKHRVYTHNSTTRKPVAPDRWGLAKIVRTISGCRQLRTLH